MFRQLTTTFFLALVLTLAAAPEHVRAQTQPSLTAREIIDRYVEARGGMERIMAIRTLILRGEGSEGDRPMRPGRAMTRARPYYLLVGDPAIKSEASFAEGNDGTHWEYYRDPGLVLRPTGAPADAIRHTAYFDDPLVTSTREPGWSIELAGIETINSREAFKLNITFPDGFTSHYFVDCATFLIVATRMAAPVHAFGEPIRSETRWMNWQAVEGALFATEHQEVELGTERILNRGRWTSIEANASLPSDTFTPPVLPDTPLIRMLNAAYAARAVPTDSLGWYVDFRNDPANATVDTQVGMASIGYQILKTGAVATAVLLLEANARDYPTSPMALFGLGRAYRTAGRIPEAIEAFRRALAADPSYTRATDALREIEPDHHSRPVVSEAVMKVG